MQELIKPRSPKSPLQSADACIFQNVPCIHLPRVAISSIYTPNARATPQIREGGVIEGWYRIPIAM